MSLSLGAPTHSDSFFFSAAICFILLFLRLPLLPSSSISLPSQLPLSVSFIWSFLFGLPVSPLLRLSPPLQITIDWSQAVTRGKDLGGHRLSSGTTVIAMNLSDDGEPWQCVCVCECVCVGRDRFVKQVVRLSVLFICSWGPNTITGDDKKWGMILKVRLFVILYRWKGPFWGQDSWVWSQVWQQQGVCI